MGKPEKVTNPSAVPQDRKRRTGTPSAPSDHSSVPSIPSVPSAVRRQGTTLEALQAITSRDEGWLRVVSQDFGAVVHFKYKFSKGRHKNSYVWFRCDDYDLSAALWGLLDKLDKVDAGLLRPTPDTAYD